MSFRTVNRAARIRWILAAPLLVLLTGCGGNLHSVEGKVVFPDGTPLTGGTIEFAPVNKDAMLGPRAEIREDGTFSASTHKEGDGAPEGEYRVQITPPDNEEPGRPKPQPFDRRFSSYEKSGLKYTVKPGRNEFFTITVERPKSRKASP
jgi:hypothetical protein